MRDFPAERIAEQAAMYALSMLSQSEARAFDHCLAEALAGYAEELAAFNAVVAEMALGAEEQAPAASLRDRLLARIAGEAKRTEKDGIGSGLASHWRQSRSVRLNEGEWRRFADGVFIKTLFVDRSRGTITSLVKLEPGARFPRHRHPGIEESLIIEGDCRVNGQVLMPGDYRCAGAGTVDGDLTTEHGAIFLVVAPREMEVADPPWKR